MAITQKPKSVDAFITAAPDANLPTASITGLAAKAKRGKQRSQVSVVLPDALLVKINAATEKNYMSRSAFITMAVTQALDRMGSVG